MKEEKNPHQSQIKKDYEHRIQKLGFKKNKRSIKASYEESNQPNPWIKCGFSYFVYKQAVHRAKQDLNESCQKKIVSKHSINDRQKIGIKRSLPENLLSHPVACCNSLRPVVVSLAINNGRMKKGIIGYPQKMQKSWEQRHTK